MTLPARPMPPGRVARARQAAACVVLAVAGPLVAPWQSAGPTAAASRPGAVAAAAAVVVEAPGVAGRTVELVDGARRSVLLEMYELGNPLVVAALEAARHRGVAVRVILDPTEGQSRASAGPLSRAGVAVRLLRVAGGIDHVKLLVVDGAAVLTGGVNLGAWSSDTTDLDVQLTGAAGAFATAVFDRDWRAAAGQGRPASGAFGPIVTGGAIEPAMLAVVDTAHGSCTVLANYLTDWTIRDALVAAERRGVHVTVLLNPTAYGAAEAEAALRRGGIRVEVAATNPYLHAKVLACGSAAVVGSANFSYDGMTVNHELDVTLTGPAAEAVSAAAARLAAGAPVR